MKNLTKITAALTLSAATALISGCEKQDANVDTVPVNPVITSIADGTIRPQFDIDHQPSEEVEAGILELEKSSDSLGAILKEIDEVIDCIDGVSENPENCYSAPEKEGPVTANEISDMEGWAKDMKDQYEEIQRQMNAAGFKTQEK